MDRVLVENWNATVNEKDTVYILGDFCINRRALPIAAQLHGRKILVKGNHDVLRLEEYSQYFQDVRACVVLQRAILTHIPIHPSQLGRFRHNIHGHLHSGHVMVSLDDMYGGGIIRDDSYTCVSVEHTGYKPIDLDKLLGTLPE